MRLFQTVNNVYRMQCHVNPDGSWTTEIIGCQTPAGTFVPAGGSATEDGIVYNCVRSPTGDVRMNRQEQADCGGHAVGESWIENKNFNKICDADGERVLNCVTDSGKPVAIGAELTEGSIIFKCVDQGEGMVNLLRVKSGGCDANGEQKKAGDTWVEDGFVYRCLASGGVIIEKCVFSDGSTIDVNSKSVHKGKTYNCELKPDGSVELHPE
ncbi:unnamed protein product [Anisakis simplex]|uniref:Ig-like domain-containing protein n=1 Tax=Anisakis simplex TaxID=6269 RepID=A0A0M3J118_ANISI|nr:unnamed protein product [Anisakis simplex]